MDSPTPYKRPFAKLRLLIVDDDADLTEFFKQALADEFSLIMVASGLVNAKSVIDGPFIFHIVVCDYFLPDGTGTALLTWLRKDRNSQVPFLMISGKIDTLTIKDARTGFLSKPFSAEDLLSSLDEFRIAARSTSQLRTRI